MAPDLSSLAGEAVRGVGIKEIGFLAALLCISIPLAIFIYNVHFHPLAGFPGPVLYRGFDSFKVYQQMTGHINDKLHELHEKYGDVVRIAPWELSYTSATAWRDIYGNRQGIGCLPPNPIYGTREKELFGAYGLLWLQDAGEHARHRKVLGPAFSDRSLREQEGILTRYVDLLISRMHEHAAVGKVVDIWAWMNFTTFDIIGDLTFGESFHCLEESRFHPWIHFLFSRLKMMMYGQIMLTMGWLGYIVEMLVPKRIKEEAVHHVRLTKDKVNRRRARDTQRPDFMTNILQHTDPGREKGMGSSDTISLAELYADAQILVMAGSETSATLLANAIYCLLRNPQTMERLKREVRSGFDAEKAIRFVAVSKLTYLGGVINEALRTRPPLPAGIHRKVGPGGAVVDGKFVAEGTSLQVTHWAAYHSGRNFADPWGFHPERWLAAPEEAEAGVADVDQKMFAADNKEVFQPFSMGTRNCIGRSLAYMETRLILARLVWNFDMELMTESEGWSAQRVFMLYEKIPLMVRLTAVQREEVVVGKVGSALSNV